MIYLRKFDNHAAYEAAESSLILPNVSLCVNENEVHYKPYVETRVVAKFNVTDTSSPTPIGYNQYTSGFSTIEIDGVVQPSVVSAYTFSTTGEHTVKYTLTDTTTIGMGAFNLCTSLTSVIIPNSVTSLGDGAFYGCRSLTSIDIPNGVTSIGQAAFKDCSGLSSVTIPNSVTSIGVSAFQTCSGLTSVTIGNGVTSIGSYAFSDCSGLTSVTIGNSVTSISDNAFHACTGLTSVTIPNSVTSIGGSAFNGCSSLSTITSYIMNAPSVNGGTFYNVSNGGTLYVPIGSSGYETWMNDQGNLGLYNWTKVEQ